MSRPSSFLCGSISLAVSISAFGQQTAAPSPTRPAVPSKDGTAQPIPQPLTYPAVPGALPPGLYRAGAMPIAPPAFYDLNPYFNSGYAPYGGITSAYGGYGQGYGFGGYDIGNVSARTQREIARIPYQTAVRDAQDYHYLNQIYKRDETLLQQNVSKTSAGTALFRSGRYEQAAVQLLNAADSNQADALSRVRAGHAMFALGRYDQAVKLIARAFELQPGLATLQFDLREEYGHSEDFEAQAATLERAVAARPRDPAAMLMLGYVRYYSSGPGSAYPTLQTAKRLDPSNELIDKLLSVAGRVYSPEQPAAQRARANSSSKGDATRTVRTTRTPVRKI